MPLDYADLQRQVNEQIQQRRSWLAIHRQEVREARAGLQRLVTDLNSVRQKVEEALNQATYWRGAAPREAPTATHPPSQAPLPEDLTLLAVDGSQIFPNRHEEVHFGLINLGMVVYSPQRRPQVFVRTHLLLENDPTEEEGALSQIALLRDLRERQGLVWLAAHLRRDAQRRREIEAHFPALAQHSPSAGDPATLADYPADGPILSLTDGPLELWGPRQEERASYEKNLTLYLEALAMLQDLKVLPVGYVDQPRANPLVRTLELLATGDPETRRWPTVCDADLMRPLLGPGERSALFDLRATSLKPYDERQIGLAFFYLNLSHISHQPWIARVEVPAWITPEELDLIHRALLWQAHLVPERLYPYALHRAHETALVTAPEREHVRETLLYALRAHGLAPGQRSQKQRLKDDISPRRETL